MKRLLLLSCLALGTQFAFAHPQPSVVIANVALVHEDRGWRVQEARPGQIQWNLIKDDLIIRIEGKNAAETGPMQMASYFNEGYRRAITAYIKRGDFGQEITLRAISGANLEPTGTKPFAHVAKGFSLPDLDIETVNNGEVTADRYKNKWILIEFGASWCRPSLDRLPEVLSLSEKEKDRMAVLAIEMDYKARAIQDLIESRHITIPVASMSHMASLPIQLGVSEADFFSELPAFVLVQPDGEVALIVIGAGKTGDMAKTVTMKLDEGQ